MRIFPDDFMECDLHNASYLLVSILIQCDAAGVSSCEISDIGNSVNIPASGGTASTRVIDFSKVLFRGITRVWFLLSKSDRKFFGVFLKELSTYGLKLPNYGLVVGPEYYRLPADVFMEVHS